MKYQNLKNIIDKYSKSVIEQAKQNLIKDKKGGGALYNSLSYDVDVETNVFLLEFLMEDYGSFVDKGVRGYNSTYPETRAALSQFRYGSGTGPKGGLNKGIDTWLRQKKFRWRDDLGRFISYKSMRYLIVQKIYNQGLKANLFFTKPFEEGLRTLGDEILNGFALDVEKQTIFGQK